MGDKVDNILEVSIAAVIGILMICSLVIPVGWDAITSLGPGYDQWNGMLEIVIVMTIIGLIIAIVRYFTTSNKR
jgi:uncharacterized protein involved in cysteine biosynthesis